MFIKDKVGLFGGVVKFLFLAVQDVTHCLRVSPSSAGCVGCDVIVEYRGSSYAAWIVVYRRVCLCSVW